MSTLEKLNEAMDAADGNVYDISLFKEILKTFPAAAVSFKVRNFSDPIRLPAVYLYVKGLGCHNQAYCMNVPLTVMFPELEDWVKDMVGDTRGWLPIGGFVDNGEKIASLLGRKFTFTHQFGSGRQEEARFKNYGPFIPAEDRARIKRMRIAVVALVLTIIGACTFSNWGLVFLGIAVLLMGYATDSYQALWRILRSDY